MACCFASVRACWLVEYVVAGYGSGAWIVDFKMEVKSHACAQVPLKFCSLKSCNPKPLHLTRTHIFSFVISI